MSVIIVTLWQAVGYRMIIFLAGLQDTPSVYYEAARIDGAGPWQRFRRITLPLLKPTGVFVLLISFIGAFQLFDPIFVLTNGGQADATTTTVFYIYQTAFEFLQLGYASTLSVALIVITLIVSLLQLRLFRVDPDHSKGLSQKPALELNGYLAPALVAWHEWSLSTRRPAAG